MIEIVDERSIRTDIMTPGGWVLDVGAHGYVFARYLLRLGMNVVAIDPTRSPSHYRLIPLNRVDGALHLIEGGLVGIHKGGKHQFASWDNGECDHLVGFGGPIPERAAVRMVDCYDVQQIMERFGINMWDCIKFNCEGAEYDILRTLPGPISKQITVSFHDHTGANPRGQATYDELLPFLEQVGYRTVRHVWEERYSAGFSFWDSLFVLKEFV